jgi:hypothetical protein
MVTFCEDGDNISREYVDWLRDWQLFFHHVDLSRVLVPCCRQVAACTLRSGGSVCVGGLTGHVETQASRRDGQLRHHSCEHGVSGTGSGRSAQAGVPQGERLGSERSVSSTYFGTFLFKFFVAMMEILVPGVIYTQWRQLGSLRSNICTHCQQLGSLRSYIYTHCQQLGSAVAWRGRHRKHSLYCCVT